jgi:hypothetical protein
MAQLIEIKVPDIGDFKDVPVIELLVKVGDTVKAEEWARPAALAEGRLRQVRRRRSQAAVAHQEDFRRRTWRATG